jgi:hypothetical protein
LTAICLGSNSRNKAVQWVWDFRELKEMPKKIRELKQLLRKAGFQELPGKGSHTTGYIHSTQAK